MRDIAATAVVMVVLLAVGFIAGWHWHGQEVDRAVSRAVTVAKQRHESEKKEWEARIAAARGAANDAVRAAEQAEKDRSAAIDAISASTGSEIEVINRHIREVFR